MVENVSRIFHRSFYIFTESPPEQYTNSKIKIGQVGKKPSNEYENDIKVFDDVLGSSNAKSTDQFFIGGKHEKLDKVCLSQSYFDSSEGTRTNKNQKLSLFKQSLKDIERIYIDFLGYDMSHV